MTTRNNNSGFSILIFTITTVIVCIVIATGFLVYNQSHKPKKVSSSSNLTNTIAKSASTNQANSVYKQKFVLPANWSWYTNTDYGFKIAYPDKWGAPRATTTDKGTVGHVYDTSWFSANDFVANVRIDSVDYEGQGCNDSGTCHTYNTTNTAAVYSKELKIIKDNSYDNSYYTLVNNNEDSYATILVNTQEATNTSLINSYRVVSILKINSSAAYGEFELLDSSPECVPKQLSPVSANRCITQPLVDDLVNVMSSLQPL